MLDDLSAGQVLGRYELLLPIAKGGMASVWAARLRGTRGFQKMVAIKTMLPGSGRRPALRAHVSGRGLAWPRRCAIRT